jgi:branched-chain amino acid transport system substrate-binding protein
VGPATGTPVTIGNIGEYSGATGASVYSGQAMAQVVAKYINDHCGLNGHPIKLISADDQVDPARYLALAQQMVQNSHAIAFLNQQVPISEAGADQYLQQQKIPVVGGDGVNVLWTTNPYLFFPGPYLSTLVLAGANFAKRTGKTTVGVMYCGEAEPCRTFNQVYTSPQAAQQGIKVAYSAQISLAQPDFTSECLQAQSHGVTALALGMDANSFQRATRSCAQQGYHPQYLGISIEFINNMISDADINNAIAPIATFPWFQSDLPAQQAYHSAIARYDPGLVESATTSIGWVSGMVLQYAGQNLPKDNPGPADIINGLYTIKNNDFGGLTVPVTFNKGANTVQPSCYFTVQALNGKWSAPTGSKAACL